MRSRATTITRHALSVGLALVAMQPLAGSAAVDALRTSGAARGPSNAVLVKSGNGMAAARPGAQPRAAADRPDERQGAAPANPADAAAATAEADTSSPERGNLALLLAGVGVLVFVGMRYRAHDR